jgi:hypothetical protein
MKPWQTGLIIGMATGLASGVIVALSIFTFGGAAAVEVPLLGGAAAGIASWFGVSLAAATGTTLAAGAAAVGGIIAGGLALLFGGIGGAVFVKLGRNASGSQLPQPVQAATLVADITDSSKALISLQAFLFARIDAKLNLDLENELSLTSITASHNGANSIIKYINSYARDGVEVLGKTLWQDETAITSASKYYALLYLKGFLPVDVFDFTAASGRVSDVAKSKAMAAAKAQIDSQAHQGAL